MSQDNVEVLRRLYDAIQRSFDAYWRNPRSLTAALEGDDLWPELREALAYLDPQVEWRTALLGQTCRGYLELAKFWDDYLTWAQEYRLG